MAQARRASAWLTIGLVTDFVCSLLTVLQLVSPLSGTVLNVASNVVQVFATTLMIVGLFCLQPLSHHFATAFWWRVVQGVAYLVLVVLATLLLSSSFLNPAGQESPIANVALVLTSLAIYCLLTLFANREMLMGTYVALGSLGSPKRKRDRVCSTSTLVLVSYSLLVASLLAMAPILLLLNQRTTSIPLALGVLFAGASLVVSLVFVLVVNVLVIMRVKALYAVFVEVLG